MSQKVVFIYTDCFIRAVDAISTIELSQEAEAPVLSQKVGLSNKGRGEGHLLRGGMSNVFFFNCLIRQKKILFTFQFFSYDLRAKSYVNRLQLATVIIKLFSFVESNYLLFLGKHNILQKIS